MGFRVCICTGFLGLGFWIGLGLQASAGLLKGSWDLLSRVISRL